MSSFSYAQAAKGISSTSASAGPTSKVASGSITPAKDAAPTNSTLPTNPLGVNNAEDDDTAAAPLRKVQKELEKSSSTKESQTNGVSHGGQANGQLRNQVSGVASPEFGGTASSSTLGKDDDVSSLANASSESTWENKSQGSAAVEKSSEQNGVIEEKSKKGQAKEKVTAKPLHEAPPPAVNIWKQRAGELAAKVTPLPQAPKKGPTSIHAVPSISSVKSLSEKTNETAKPDHKRKIDDKAGQGRRDTRAGKSPSKEDTPNVVAPLPPTRDEQSWPTVETAQDEDKKKAVSKPEKDEKDRTTATSRAHGKNEWVSMPYTPTVVFNTPLPNPGNRRGGRGGSRGGSTATSRGGAYNAAASPEKDSTATSTTSPNGDVTKRERNEGAGVREFTAEKSTRRATSAGPHYKEGKHSGAPNERSERVFKTSTDSQNGHRNIAGENSGFPTTQGGPGSKHSMSGRQKPSRKYEGSPADKAREGDVLSSTHDNPIAIQEVRTSSVTASERTEGGQRKPSSAVETTFPPSKHSNGERRNGPFGSMSGRERGEGRGRGGMRGGRGGNTSYNNHGAHGFSNGISGMQPGQYGIPRSPSSFSDASSYFGPPQPQGRYSRNGGRPHSMAMDSYGRASNGYHSQQLSPIQTFMPGMYDQPFPQQPMTAMPYNPMMEEIQLFPMIQMQLEYYFSVENLCKDMFMRKHMDSQGFVFLSFIADFNRIKQLSGDLDIIKTVCFESHVIDYRLGDDGKDRLRRRDGWEQWVLNTPERDVSAQNDGPRELHWPPRPHLQSFGNLNSIGYPQQMSARGASSPGLPQNEATYQSLQNIANTSMANGQHSRVTVENAQHAEPFSPSSNTNVNGHSINASGPPAMNPEADSFSDQQIEGLKIIVRDMPPQSQAPPAAIPFHNASSRTFSNGSIDSQNISEDTRTPEQRSNGIQANGVNATHGDDRRPSLNLQRTLSPQSVEKVEVASPLNVFWVKDKDKPVDTLPPATTGEYYTQHRIKALEQRQLAPFGSCPYDMEVLYQFWSHFLIRNFNTRMYNEFRQLAFEDLHQRGSDSGITSLIKYFWEALMSPRSVIRQRVARHYIEFVTMEPIDGERLAFKQLRSAWRNGALNMKNRKKISDYVDPALKAALEA